MLKTNQKQSFRDGKGESFCNGLVNYAKQFDFVVLDDVDMSLKGKPHSQKSIANLICKIVEKSTVVIMSVAKPDFLPSFLSEIKDQATYLELKKLKQACI